jgi:hypothetical protein
MPYSRSGSRIRPGRWAYLLAVIFLIVSVVSLWVMFSGLFGFAGNATRIAAPRQEQISVSEAGQYAIAYEYQSVLDGHVVTAPETMPAMNITVVRADTKAPVALTATGGEFTYTAGSTAGRIMAHFTVDRPGDYIVASRYSDGADQPQAVLAIGPDPTEFFLPSLLIGIAGVALAPLVWLIAFVLRRNSRRRIQQAPPTAGVTQVPAADAPEMATGSASPSKQETQSA